MANETFQTVKLPGALFAELGATSADFADKLAAFFADAKATKASLESAESAVAASASTSADFTARLAVVEKSVADFKAADSAAILADCVKAAKLEASSVASAILAKTGGDALPASAPASAPAQSANKIKRADFAKLSASEQSKFCIGGGSVED